MRQNAQRTGPAVEAHYQFLNWLMPTIGRFPREQRFLLGDRIQSTALDVLEALIEATYTHDRRAHLTHANLGLEKLRFFFRLAHEQRHLDARRYEHAARARLPVYDVRACRLARRRRKSNQTRRVLVAPRYHCGDRRLLSKHRQDRHKGRQDARVDRGHRAPPLRFAVALEYRCASFRASG
jgi:hypothetical protein